MCFSWRNRLRTGLPVWSMPMIRSCVLGLSSRLQKCLRSMAIRVFLGHHRAGLDLAAAHHVGDATGQVVVVRAHEAAITHVGDLA